MLEVIAVVGVVVVIVVVSWIFLHPKQKGGNKRARADRPGEKRVSNIPFNRDSKIEGMGDAIIKTSDRRKKG